MCPITINKALLLQEGILKFELSWTAVTSDFELRDTTRKTLGRAISWWSMTRAGDRKGMLIIPFKENAISEIEVVLNEF